MKKRFRKSVIREGSLVGIQAWDRGERFELQKWQPFIPIDYCFLNKNGVYTLFYEEKEDDTFCRDLQIKFDDGKNFFERLTRDFIFHVEQGRRLLLGTILSRHELVKLYEIMIACWPATTLFYESVTNWGISVERAVLDEMARIRKEYSGFLYDAEKLILRSLREIFPAIRGFENLVTIEEVHTGSFVSRAAMQQRRIGHIYFNGALIVGMNFEDFLEARNFEIVEKENGDEIRGRSAMGGKVTGKVKLVFRVEDVENVEKGDILVAPMTTPDHVMAMEKAGGFVTDEGGITCHAAIVAREFGKPCIVGTDNATKVLKDGDMVLVDADNGIVERMD